MLIAAGGGRRWALIALPVVLLLGAAFAIVRLPALGIGASAGTTPTSYEPQVMLGPDLVEYTEVTGGPAMNRSGQIVIVAADHRARSHLYILDGSGTPIRLTGEDGSPAPIHPPEINDRGFVAAAADVPDSEHGAVRDVRLWSAVAGREWGVIDRGRPSVDEADDREQILGTRVTIDESGPFRVVLTRPDDGGPTTQHLAVDPAGTSPPIIEGDEPDALRPTSSAGGVLVVSTGSELLVIEPGLRERTVLAGEDFEQLGRAPAISADGSAIAFTGTRDGETGVWVSRRDLGGNWSRPVLVTGGGGDGPALEPVDIDAPVGVAGVRRPPEDGDPLVVSVMARTSSPGTLSGSQAADDDGGRDDGVVEYTTETGLWTLSTVLRGADPDPASFTTRLVAQVGASLNGGEMTDLEFHGALRFPESGVSDEADHWIAYVAVSDGAELIVRSSPAGSWVERAARTVEEMRHDHGGAEDPGRFGDPGPDHDHGDRPEDRWGRPYEPDVPEG